MDKYTGMNDELPPSNTESVVSVAETDEKAVSGEQSAEPKDGAAAVKEQNRKRRAKPKKKHPYGWLVWGISVLFLSFALTVIFSFLAEVAIADSPSFVCVIVLLVLLVLNISCDVLANAILSCTTETFHSMASNKVKGAKRAVTLCKNATKLASIFADVIGDICGIVSGSAGAALVIHIAASGTFPEIIWSILVSAIIGALTVGGKAIFKHVAITFNKQIVFGFAKFTTIFKREK